MGIFSKNPQISYHINMSRKVLTQNVRFQCLDNPDSGRLAKVIAYLDLVIILIAVVAQCLESLPQIRAECPPDQSWK